MRTLLLVFCALLMMNSSLEARKKVKIKMPAAQKTQVSRQHSKTAKRVIKSRKMKHRQKVN
jgi:hypothetical protein